MTAELCTAGMSLWAPSSPLLREALSYGRSRSVPSLGDGAGLAMAWDESLGMDRQSSDKMVAQDGGVPATALEPLPPTTITLQCDRGTPGVDAALCSCPWRASVSGQRCQSRGTSPHVMPLWGWH